MAIPAAEHVAGVLARCATLLAIDGAAEQEVETCWRAVETLQAGQRPVIPTGSRWGQIAEELLELGYSPSYVQWTQRMPESILELAQIPGFSPDHLRLLRDRLAVYSWFDLSLILGENRHLMPMVPEIDERLWQSAAAYLQARRPILPSVFLGVEGQAALQTLLAAWEASPPPFALYPVGDVVLGRELIGQLDVIAGASPAALDAFVDFAQSWPLWESRYPSPLSRTLRFGESRRPKTDAPPPVIRTDTTVILSLPNGLPARLTLVPEERLAEELVRRRSAPDHWAQVARGEAVMPHYRDTFDLEAAFYRSRGLAYIPPELRTGPIAQALWLAGSQHRLLSEMDMRGDLHMHTVWSDGKGTIEQMVAKACELGYEYLAICEHSPRIQAANGLDPDRLAAHRAAIDALQAQFPAIRILAGAEVDILPDGSLDYDDEVLARLDLVIASVHANFELDRAAQTRRIEAAMRHPHVDIIGHMTGRILNNCPAYPIDLEQLIATAAATGTVLEVNATPNRLDLPAEAARQALTAGARLAVNTDSHTPDGLAAMSLGVAQARRAGAQAAQVINTWPLAKLHQWLQTPKAQRRSPA